jgi:hypothetical protein
MALCGGLRGVAPSLVYPIWLVIIFRFLVSFMILFGNVLLIPMGHEATTIDVERVFSCGRLVLPFVRSRLNVQSTRALMCVGSWSLLGLIDDPDIKAAIGMDMVNGKEDELPIGWDTITTD